MDQTTFVMDDDQRLMSTPVHVKGEDGSWLAIGEVLNQSPEYWSGGHGLYGPPSDYIKFEQALLRGGELGGTGSCASPPWTQLSATRSASWTSPASSDR